MNKISSATPNSPSLANRAINQNAEARTATLHERNERYGIAIQDGRDEAYRLLPGLSNRTISLSETETTLDQISNDQTRYATELFLYSLAITEDMHKPRNGNDKPSELVMRFNEALEAMIDSAYGTKVTPQMMVDILVGFARTGFLIRPDEQKVYGEKLMTLVVGKWNEVTVKRLFEATNIGVIDASKLQDRNGADFFGALDSRKKTWMVFDVKSSVEGIKEQARKHDPLGTYQIHRFDALGEILDGEPATPTLTTPVISVKQNKEKGFLVSIDCGIRDGIPLYLAPLQYLPSHIEAVTTMRNAFEYVRQACKLETQPRQYTELRGRLVPLRLVGKYGKVALR